jgi:hypothetical protein
LATKFQPSFCYETGSVRTSKKISLAVTVGDLLVVVYLVLVITYLVHQWRGGREDESDDDDDSVQETESAINRAA